ncbi:MAG: DNA repair protein RecO [Muribaculaceae bacterium]|nr:DNA repair protein RecO [Muribaculaceae bacterium]
MKLESDGILISLRPFNERDSIAHIFTHDYGVVCGMMRGAVIAKKNRPLVGQIGAMTWNARLDSQLGVLHWDAHRNMAATLMMDATRLSFMNAAFNLIDTLLPEREQYPELYNDTIEMLSQMAHPAPAPHYLQWEINLLRELGYALDLTRCSGCGTRENLNYISPRTGRAVCDTCAAPYIGRVYKIPLDLNVTLRFLDAICAQQGTNIPLARKMLNRV